MKNMKEKFLSKIGEKVALKLGQASIRLSERSFSSCFDFFSYEPKISVELLKTTIEK